MRVALYILDANKGEVDSVFLLPFFKDTDRETVSKYKTLEARNEKAASCYLKNKYVGDYRIGEKGKPISDSVHFNVSHSRGFVILAISDKEIGADVELVRPVEDDLKRYVSNGEEYNAIHSDYDFFALWTNKESLLKAVGVGIDRRLNEVPGLPLNGIRHYEGKEYRSKTMDYQGYLITLTVEGSEDFEIEVHKEEL